MRLFDAISRLASRIYNADMTMDGEGSSSYMLLVAIGGPTCLGLWFYGSDLLSKGQMLAGFAVIIGCGLLVLLIVITPFVYQSSTDATPYEIESEPSSEVDLDRDI